MYELFPGYVLPAAFVYTIAAFFGFVLGSFYTALASRILYFFYGPGRKEFVEDGGRGRWYAIFLRPSHCFACGHHIRGLELVPLFGYLATRGRCSNCGASIGRFTLAGEIFPAILFPILLASGQSPMGALFTVLLCGHLYIAIATDWHLFLLDHENALFLILWSVAATWENNQRDFETMYSHLVVCAVSLVILLVLFFLSRMRGLGFGDVILGGVLALYAGYPWALVFFQLGAAASLVYIFAWQKDRRAPAPLGVFLALGFFVSTLLEALWEIYRI